MCSFGVVVVNALFDTQEMLLFLGRTSRLRPLEMWQERPVILLLTTNSMLTISGGMLGKVEARTQNWST
jgi:hypothetical protein